jgi:cytochrome c-type biogenesis protein CcsB
VAVNESLAQASNVLVYGSMAAYAGALLAFTASLASTRGRDLEPAAQPATGTAATAGGGTATLVRQATATTVTTVTTGTATATATKLDGGGVTPTSKIITGRSTTEPPLPPGRRAGNIGMSLTWLAMLLLAGGVLLRGLAAGRPPWGNMYEFSTASALAITVAFLAISLRRDVRWLGVFVVLPVLLTLGLAVTVLYTEAAQLVPALKSYWLVIHVTLAIVCGGALCVAAAVTALYLVADSGRRRAGAGKSFVLAPLVARLPTPERLDALSYRMTAFMFPLWTFTVVAGAIWAENAWGRYWGWDPKETWAFITWVAYATYLHARATAGWKGRKAAYLGLVAFGCFIFNYYGVNIFLGGLHAYSGLN